MPRNVAYRGKSGKHGLLRSISGFDPTRTSDRLDLCQKPRTLKLGASGHTPCGALTTINRSSQSISTAIECGILQRNNCRGCIGERYAVQVNSLVVVAHSSCGAVHSNAENALRVLHVHKDRCLRVCWFLCLYSLGRRFGAASLGSDPQPCCSPVQSDHPNLSQSGYMVLF